MIVRLHQIDPADAEALTFWNTTDLRGPIPYHWPIECHGYQVTALDIDEKHQPVPDPVRRRRLRQLLPTMLNGLAAPGYQTVLRFDGPLIDGEMLAVFRYLADNTHVERYCISPVQQFNGRAAVASVRVLPTDRTMASLCNDVQIGIEKSVRLRAFCVPELLVNPLLDTSDLDDERWRDLLGEARYVISTARGLLSAVIWTPSFEPHALKLHALGAAQ